MKYTAQFYDINEKLYTLEIGSGEVQNITYLPHHHNRVRNF